jgi:TonB family protein
MSIALHASLLAAFILGPRLPIFQLSPEELQQRELQRQRPNENRTFVFVQPQVDLRALLPRPNADLSDADRRAQARERMVNPLNPQPLARGNTPERVEAPIAPRRVEPEPPQQAPQEPETQTARALPPPNNPFRRELPAQPRAGTGPLSEALRNLQRYVQNESFDNPQGGANDPGATIQFDTKGVEFGPWLRRFVAQVRRNWFIPQAAFTMRGHVVLQFNIHRDGSITDLVIVGESDINAFNNAAFNAIRLSNPTVELPAEYPADKAFFTVTFYYNEDPDR